MFRKIQHYLLLKQPLLWNTKAIPTLTILAVFHILFFGIGYLSGALDFNQTSRNYNSNEETVVFFSVLISILSVIIWLVFYFKNNAFKALYPKSNWALLQEWSLLFVICFTAGSFSMSYFLGIDTKIRSYYTETEAKKRCETLSKASIFYGENFDAPEEIDTTINDTTRPFRLDYVRFKGKKYSLNSLLNKDIHNYSFYDSKWDSVTKVKVKSWLIDNQQDSVKTVLKEYFALVNEHRLTSNINAQQWFELIPTAPDFIQTHVIAKREKDYYNGGNYNYDYENEYNEAVAVEVAKDGKIDSLNEYLKYIGKDEFVFYKTYVPADELEYNYEKIANTYTNPTVSSQMLLAFLYLAIGLSILIFSFRVTSGRSWLIALISMGVLNIIFGILSVVFRFESFYLIALLATIIILFTYFMVVIKRQKAKGISGITLNASLWLLPAWLPVMYQLLLEFLRHVYGYYDYNSYDYNMGFDYDNYPLLKFLKDNGENMLWFNLLFIVALLCFYSIQIKKWKALAEG
ncbi:hypothetical protein [Flavobacterium sedimenticola]|uniref:ABC transporter permease n=1 Tax=Flavobacterium sedimenticola TaxID=3043286 RepID=A0ABT6XPK6_9FLAO|nr:hypothetical protein [Flavobacterium sedimenticola]MDI9257023.1 hypothetical protein [Flavobacterium sedimenticola]